MSYFKKILPYLRRQRSTLDFHDTEQNSASEKVVLLLFLLLFVIVTAIIVGAIYISFYFYRVR
jgi:hypothetical protein